MGVFVKGQAKLPNAGRRPGSANKKTRIIRDFAAQVLESPDYILALRGRIRLGDAPEIEKLLYHYAYGRPPDKVELSNPDGSLRPVVQFYLPQNFRGAKT